MVRKWMEFAYKSGRAREKAREVFGSFRLSDGSACAFMPRKY